MKEANSGKQQRWLTIRQAADEIGVSERQIRRWRTAGRFKAFQVGSIVRIDRDAMEAFFAAHTGYSPERGV